MLKRRTKILLRCTGEMGSASLLFSRSWYANEYEKREWVKCVKRTRARVRISVLGLYKLLKIYVHLQSCGSIDLPIFILHNLRPLLYNTMMAQMAHFAFLYFTIPNSEFRNLHYEFRNSEFGIVKYM